MYLSVSKENRTTRVSLLRHPDFTKPHPEVHNSPIFPVIPSQEAVDDLSPSCHILLAYPPNPFSTMGFLLGKLNDEQRIRTLFFSHGLASLISITTDTELLQTIQTLLEGRIAAYEIWDVNNGVLASSEYSSPTPQATTLSYPSQTELLPVDIQALIHEYKSSIILALGRAAQFSPDHFRILLDLQREVYFLIEHLLFFLVEGAPRPTNLEIPAEALASILSDPARRLSYVQFNVDQLLQINSRLSYVITQMYSGIPPILEHECPVKNFSLLGIGSAARALIKIYQSVNMVFARHPIPRVLLDVFKDDYTPIPIFKNYAEYDVNKWRAFSTLLDTKLRLLTPSNDDLMFHQTYFSGQDGFRETTYGISAALQSLFVSCTPRWTLLTLTHEFLHAHVRGIIGTLLQEREPSILSTLTDLYHNYESISLNPTAINTQQRYGLILISVLSSMVACNKAAQSIRDKMPNKQAVPRLSANDMFFEFTSKLKPIHETIAHTLDFLYFYGSNSRFYTMLIWLTWSTLPEIQERLSEYILRTLLSLSVNEIGTLNERYDKAKATILDCFANMIDNAMCYNDTIIKQAIYLLKDDIQGSALKAEFTGLVRLADMAKYLLHSDDIHREVMSDTLLAQDANGNDYYDISESEFQDRDIASPISFIVDRAKRALNVEPTTDYDASLRNSCWELLVLASAKLPQ